MSFGTHLSVSIPYSDWIWLQDITAKELSHLSMGHHSASNLPTVKMEAPLYTSPTDVGASAQPPGRETLTAPNQPEMLPTFHQAVISVSSSTWDFLWFLFETPSIYSFSSSYNLRIHRILQLVFFLYMWIAHGIPHREGYSMGDTWHTP